MSKKTVKNNKTTSDRIISFILCICLCVLFLRYAYMLIENFSAINDLTEALASTSLIQTSISNDTNNITIIMYIVEIIARMLGYICGIYFSFFYTFT